MALGRHGSFELQGLRVNAVPQQGCCVKGCKPVIGHPAERRRSKTIRLTRSECGHHLRILRGNEPVSQSDPWMMTWP